MNVATRILKAWRDLSKLPGELWILCLAIFVNRCGTMALPFLVLYLTESLKFSAGSAAGMLAVYGVTALLVGPISGKLSDRWGALLVLQTMLAAFGVVLMLFPLAHTLPAVAVMTILFALTNAAAGPASQSMVGSLSSIGHRKAAYALARLALNLGMSVGPAVGGFLAQRSFPLLFRVDGATALLASGILVLSPLHARLAKRRAQEQAVVRSTGWIMDAAFTDATLRVFLLAVIPMAVVFWQHESTMPLFIVRELHFSESAYGMLFTLNTLMIVLMEIPLNSATAHWPHRRTLVLGSALIATGFGVLAWASTYLAIALSVAIWTFGEMLLFPTMSAYVSEIAPEGRRGEYMGLYSMAFNIAFTGAPWIGTLTLNHYGAMTLWLSMFAIGLSSAFVFGAVRDGNSNIDD